MKRKIPPYKVILWDHNGNHIEYYDIMPYLVECWKKEKSRKWKGWGFEKDIQFKTDKMPQNFEEFKLFILFHSRYQYWSRYEYEIIITGGPVAKRECKLDVYDQIENNIDIITKHFMDYING